MQHIVEKELIELGEKVFEPLIKKILDEGFEELKVWLDAKLETLVAEPMEQDAPPVPVVKNSVGLL